jgi:hypothetical protein
MSAYLIDLLQRAAAAVLVTLPVLLPGCCVVGTGT